jgi:hypothetical protein
LFYDRADLQVLERLEGLFAREKLPRFRGERLLRIKDFVESRGGCRRVLFQKKRKLTQDRPTPFRLGLQGDLADAQNLDRRARLRRAQLALHEPTGIGRSGNRESQSRGEHCVTNAEVHQVPL